MSKSFVILEPDPIVCMDLEGMLIGRFPGSPLMQGAALSDLGTAIYNCGPDTTFFVRSNLMDEDKDVSGVIETVATRGSHIVIIGPDRQTAFPATFIDLPFTTDMIVAAVDPSACPDGDETPSATP
ncbi:MAG: hypothetical protein AAGK92_01705 [Pseudomonadota bacterium]